MFFFNCLGFFRFYDALPCVYCIFLAMSFKKEVYWQYHRKMFYVQKYLAFKICRTNIKIQKVLVRELVRKV